MRGGAAGRTIIKTLALRLVAECADDKRWRAHADVDEAAAGVLVDLVSLRHPGEVQPITRTARSRQPHR